MKQTTAAAFALCLVICGCRQNAEDNDRVLVEKQQRQYARAQPVPMFEYSIERETAIQLYKQRNERVRTWTVWRSDTGMIEGYCESIGYPIPYDVQLTNPLQPAWDAHGGVAIEQAEPNGLFSSKHTSATWVRAVISHNGRVVETPIYVEGKVTCYPYPVLVDYERNRVTAAEGGQPTVVLETAGK